LWDPVHAVWPAEYIAKGRPEGVGIVIDADLTDWDQIIIGNVLAQVPFYPYNAHEGGDGAGTWDHEEFGTGTPGGLREFDSYNGGIWNGVHDQASASAFAWDAGAIYHAVKVIDDTHQSNDVQAGWDGDSVMVELGLTRTGVTHMEGVTYSPNFGLSERGILTMHTLVSLDFADVGMVHETSEAAIVRHEKIKTTIYEIKYPARKLGMDSFDAGFSIGIGYAVNDGDTESGQGGQKGWSGWGPYAGVYCHLTKPMGLLKLAMTPAQLNITPCPLCGVGRYDHDVDPTSPCEMCPASTYQDQLSATSCIQCPMGRVSLSESRSDCSAQPRYIGCFRDRESAIDGRDMQGSRLSMGPAASAQTCASFCAEFLYMGLQWMDQCSCGNEYGTYGQVLPPLDEELCGARGDACGQNVQHNPVRYDERGFSPTGDPRRPLRAM
jgi:hypothetical protein